MAENTNYDKCTLESKEPEKKSDSPTLFSVNSERRRTKTVSFKNDVEIVNVDCWKQYNFDVSEKECEDWDYHKITKNRKELIKQDKLLNAKENCSCSIY